MEIDGLEVRESTREAGAAWQWSSQSSVPIDYEIEWVETKDVFLYGTRVRPGGWNVSQLDPQVWVGDGTIDGARAVVRERMASMPR